MAMPPTKTTYARHIRLIGLNKKTGKVSVIPRVLCLRKGMNFAAAKAVSKGFKVLGLVSSTNAVRAKSARLCRFWCHCMRNLSDYTKRPGMLLSESDFVDPAFIPVMKRTKDFRYDFVYFTAGGKRGIKHKGIDVFAKILPVLCGEFGLKGVVVKYINSRRPFVKGYRRILKKYGSSLRIKSKLKPRQVAGLMAKCRFGLFPNTRDCSPLLLSESLVRHCPVLVNDDIFGGWKYVNDQTGALFTVDNIREKLDFMLSNSFDPREPYMEHYGYENSAKRFAEEGKKHIKEFSGYRMVGLDGQADKMIQVYKRMKR